MQSVGEPNFIDKFCNCMAVTCEMLSDRGYDYEALPDNDKIRRNLRELDLANSYASQRLLNQYVMEGTHKFTQDKIKVYWLCGKIGVNSDTLDSIKNDIEKLLEIPQTSRLSIIFVTFEGANISAPAKKQIALLSASLEFFDSSELQVNLTRHELQPKFKLLNDMESKAIKDMYGVNDDQLPKYLWNDPIRRYFGAEVGQIVECKRYCESGISKVYRIVERSTD